MSIEKRPVEKRPVPDRPAYVHLATTAPWPEAFAGAIIGALMSSVLVLVPQIGALAGTVWLWALIIVGALVGAVVSWLVKDERLGADAASEGPLRDHNEHRRAA